MEARNFVLILVDFFPIECIFNFEIFRKIFWSSSVLYLSTKKVINYLFRYNVEKF